MRQGIPKTTVIIIIAILYTYFFVNHLLVQRAAPNNVQTDNFFNKINFWSGNNVDTKLKFKDSLVVNGHLRSLEERGYDKPMMLLYTRYYDHVIWPGLNACSHKCQLTTNKSLINDADLVLFQGWKGCKFNSMAKFGVQCHGWDKPEEIWDWPGRKISGQVWLYLQLESQENSANGKHLSFVDNLFNYTLAHKNDSTISFPYGTTLRYRSKDFNNYLASSKSKLILWFVSHCGVPIRDDYITQLRQHVTIDEFGKCSGNKDGCDYYDRECVGKIKRQYKFYIAFENSICDEYVTEKFWKTLYSGMVPIVLGADLKFYQQIAPPDSFLHVDNFTSPKYLADYIKKLDADDESYNRYHKWRHEYSVQSNWVQHACEVCRLATEKPKSMIKLSTWWNSETQCKSTTSFKRTWDTITI